MERKNIQFFILPSILLMAIYSYGQPSTDFQFPFSKTSFDNRMFLPEKYDQLRLNPIKFGKFKVNFISHINNQNSSQVINREILAEQALLRTDLSETLNAEFSNIKSYRRCLVVLYNFRKKE